MVSNNSVDYVALAQTQTTRFSIGELTGMTMEITRLSSRSAGIQVNGCEAETDRCTY